MISSFSNLKRASHRNKTFGKAPHKPVLLLSIIELIDDGSIRENKIQITPELVGTFQSIWLTLVPHNAWQPRFFLPFYHLTGDKFWHLEVEPGAKLALTSSYSPKSLGALKDQILYAWFDKPVFDKLMDPTIRSNVKAQILLQYFPNSAETNLIDKTLRNKYLEGIESDFLLGKVSQPSLEYSEFEKKETRSVLFKTEVPKIYRYTCAISGHQIQTTADIRMIDACHIKPWSKTQDDSIQNGISLSPTLHRAFDRFLITIDSNYRVLISPSLLERENSPYNLRQFEGTQIILPEKDQWYPSQEALEWHRSQLIT